MPNRLFKVRQKTKLTYQDKKYHITGEYPSDVGFFTDFRISLERCFNGGYDCLNTRITQFAKWFGFKRKEAETHFEIIEYDIVEVRRYTVAEARQLRGSNNA